jgi:hypothetical protein
MHIQKVKRVMRPSNENNSPMIYRPLF